jgi:hypothetical protein
MLGWAGGAHPLPAESALFPAESVLFVETPKNVPRPGKIVFSLGWLNKALVQCTKPKIVPRKTHFFMQLGKTWNLYSLMSGKRILALEFSNLS